jgi:hypothetical protein
MDRLSRRRPWLTSRTARSLSQQRMIRDLMAESFIKTSKRVYDISMICLIQRLLWDYCLCSSKTIIYPNEGLKMRSPKDYKMMQNKLEGVWFEWGNSKPSLKVPQIYEVGISL